jgi:N-acetylglucosaminyldiphosphoundecaprenol N-acetyl-beta-D-mannosaminyltransferase
MRPDGVIQGELAQRASILGVPVNHRADLDAAAEALAGLCLAAGRTQVNFVNAHCVNVAWRNSDYLSALRRSTLNLPDGAGLAWAARRLGRPLKANTNGTDLFPRLMDRISGRPIGLFLLGARPGVAEGVGAHIRANYPEVRLAGCEAACHHGYFGTAGQEEVIERINASGARLLIAALGVPYQEIWLDRTLPRLNVRVGLAAGGLFDFYSGRIRRAPASWRRWNMEWAWRLTREPGRLWKRYFLGNPVFLHRAWRQRGKME